MSRSANMFVRVEPEVKQLFFARRIGIGSAWYPTSNASGLFLRQVVFWRGIPFDLKLPQNKPLSLCKLGEEQFNAEIEKGFAKLSAGKVVLAERFTDIYNRISGYEHEESRLHRASFAGRKQTDSLISRCFLHQNVI